MSVQHLLRMPGALSIGISHFLPSGSMIRGALALASLTAAGLIDTRTASAVPSYARQTGQPCATCHTAWPELTPFGRQFKLMGYTSGGTLCGDGSAKSDETQVPLSVMAWPATFTGVKSNLAKQSPAWQAPNINNNEWIPGQFSLFVAGQLYCNVGSFAQMTYDRVGNSFGWDNTDIRYASTGIIEGTNIVYGLTANNNPTVQDVWNSTPAWSFPYISSEVAPVPGVATMLGGGTWGQQVGGVGAYVWIDDSFYAEFTAYGALNARLATDLGADPAAPRFANAAPYWRFAYERKWDKNSLMFGTFGMYADVQPVGISALNPINPTGLSYGGVTDPFLDIGVDTQYQWIGEEKIFSLRASYIWERQKLNGQSNPALNGGAPLSNPVDYVNDFNISASYIYDQTISLTVGHFNTWGTSDALMYSSLPGGVGFFTTGSPNSAGWTVDLAYLPFMHGGPDLWPWFNARLGVLYTHYDRFDGSTNNVDEVPGLKASGNDTVFLYSWLMF